MDKKSYLKACGIIILAGIVFYLCFPKYEIYQSALDGTITYRFNKITGSLQDADYNGFGGVSWGDSRPLGFIKKP